jgi:glycosyltransferase involved in cell wall biosynthesis
MFSIIIPLYNKAPYIEKAIRSVFSQTCQEFELIVIDVGSTDSSFEIANQIITEILADRTISPPLGGFRGASQPNAGVSTARNHGVALAQYPYIAFLDADDWWAPTFLEEMKNLIEEFPDAGIYGSSYYYVKNNENRFAQIGVDKDFERGYINYCQVYAKTLWMPLTSISVVLPKNIFEAEQGFNPQLKLGEDFDLWIRIAMKHPVVCLNKALAYYNQDADITFRAIGRKFYQPEEHMLFTDYGNWMQDEDFRFLFERLALYGLLPYYLNKKNKPEVDAILAVVQWGKHERKYRWYYKKLPRVVVKWYFELLRMLVFLKSKLHRVSRS